MEEANPLIFFGPLIIYELSTQTTPTNDCANIVVNNVIQAMLTSLLCFVQLSQLFISCFLYYFHYYSFQHLLRRESICFFYDNIVYIIVYIDNCPSTWSAIYNGAPVSDGPLRPLNACALHFKCRHCMHIFTDLLLSSW